MSSSRNRLTVLTRHNENTGKQQMLTGEVLSWLKRRVPKEAFLVIGLTEVDLYPKPEWNFVFGVGSLKERVGVYSLARYAPAFFGSNLPKAEARQIVLRHALDVMLHELGHMFGVAHCTRYHCAMNGSNHLGELDARPIHLCPIDLRKAACSTKLVYLERYHELEAFYERVGLRDEAAFSRQRAEDYLRHTKVPGL